MADITDLMQSATSTPSEAASNIQTATVYSMPPTNDRQVNEQLAPEARQSLKPTEASPAVHQYMSQSTEHAALAVGADEKDPTVSDIPTHNFVDDTVKWIGDIIYNRPTDDQKRATLLNRQMDNGGKLNPEDAADLYELNQNPSAGRSGPPRPPIKKGEEDTNLASTNAGDILNQTWGETGAVGRGIVDSMDGMVRGIRKNAPLIGAFTGAGALAGLAGGPLSEVTVPGGAAVGFGLGVRSAFALDAYDSTRASIYGTLSNMTDDKGQPMNIDESTKKWTSYGAGLVSAALMNVTGDSLIKAVPLLNPAVTPAMAKMAMQAPESAVMRLTLQRIGHTVATMGGVSAVAEASNIMAVEVGKHFDGTPESILNGLAAAGDSLEKWKKVGTAGLVGAGTGLVVSGVLGVTGLKQTRAQVEGISETAKGILRDTTVTMGKPAGYLGENDSAFQTPGADTPEGTGPRAGFKDITPKGKEPSAPVEPQENSVDKSVKVLRFQDAMNDATEAIKQTKMNDLAPNETSSLMQKIFDRAGIKQLYSTVQGMRNWATSPEKGEAARNLMDKTGMLASQMNAPFEIDPVKIAEIAKTDPSILDHISVAPDGPNALQARTHLENLQKASDNRVALMQKFGIEPKEVNSPEEPSNVTPIGAKAKGEEIPFDMEGYVKRADEILADNRATEQYITEKTAMLKDQKEGNVIDPELRDKLEQGLKNAPKQIEANNKELADIKSKVTEHLQGQKPGDLLIPKFGQWPEANVDSANEASGKYLDAMSVPEAIKRVLPKAETERLEAATRNAREDNLDSIHESAMDEMSKVQDQVVETAKEARLEQERERIANDPNYAIVDKIRSAFKLAKESKSTSVYAIDPKTLPKELLKFTDNPRIKATKIFQKGASNADDVASLLGLKDGADLLQVLAKTPTREQVVKARSQAFAASDENEAKASVDPNYQRAVETIQNKTLNVVAEMKFMREQEWPALKGSITRIALPPPQVEEWTQRAKDTVAQTTVGSLNANIYRAAERQSHRIAVKALLNGKWAEAYTAMGQRGVALASLKETLMKVSEIDRAQKFMRKFDHKDNQQILKFAGPTIYNAAKELSGVFNYNPKANVVADTAAYLKWVTREVKAGRGDFSIPPRLSDLRQSIKEATVEQALVVADRARVLLKSAKDKGQTLDALSDLRAKRSLDQVENQFKEAALKHKGANSKRLPEVQEKTPNRIERMIGYFLDAEELVAAKQNVIREMDEGNTGGLAYRELDAAMEGSGKHFEKSGYTYEKKLNKWINDSIEKLNKAHGDIGSFEGKFLDVSEFKDIKELRNGKLTKGDLMMAAANRGQKYTKDMLRENNGGASDALWQQVLDKYLEPKDIAHMQGGLDLYKDPAIRAKTMELQRNQGRDIEFIEGIPFTHRGVTYSGGYLPVKTVHKYSEGEVKAALEQLEGKGAAHYDPDSGANWGRQYAAETTKQGYTESRNGNNEPLDLSYHRLYDGLREIVHDHAYREPLMDFFNKMKRPGIKDSLIAMVGERKVNTLISVNLEIAGRPSAKDTGYFTNPNRNIKNITRKLGNKFAAYTIFANFHAVVIQFEMLPQMFNALGIKSVAHFAHVNWVMATSPDKIYGHIQSAAQLDPSISKYLDNIGDTTTSVLHDLIPKKGQKLERSLIGYAHDKLIMGGFLPHQMADLYLKVASAHTVMKHVMAGDHPLYSKEKINAMTPEEQFQTVQGIVQQTSTLLNIQNRNELKAPIQKNNSLAPWVPFWNYPRNIVNNTLLDVRRTSWKYKEGLDKLKEAMANKPNALQGDGGGKPPVGYNGPTKFDEMREVKGNSKRGQNLKDALGAFGSGTNMLLSGLAWRAIGGLVILYIGKKGVDWGVDKLDWSNHKDVEAAAMHVMGKVMELNYDYAVHSTPIASSMEFAAENKRKYKMADVKNPQTQQLSSITTCLSEITDILWLSRSPSRIKTRASLETGGIFFSPVVAKSIKFIADWENSHSVPDLGPGFHAQLSTAQVDDFHKDLKEFLKDPGDTNKELVAQAEALHKQLAPQTVQVPEHAGETIKMAESGGKWNSENGLYGFTSSDWKGVMHSAPELGLTENGRTSKDTTQQEKAMDFQLHQNAGLLAEKDLPVNAMTLLGAHTFGVTDYEKVYNAPGDTKVKTILSKEVIAEHPDIQNFKTIGQVKSYLSTKAESGRKALEADNNLTSKTTKNED